ncbi:unnamed protein product [Rhizoctonia solani]|nr:unnamed protein product [Rhizoctonia solani]
MSFKKRRFNLTSSSGGPSGAGSNKRPKTNDRDINNASGSCSTSTPTVSTLPNARATPTTHGKAVSKATGHAIISTLKGSMSLLLKGCGIFTPLESVVQDIVDVLEAIECTTEGNQDIYQLLSGLPQWAIVLSAYLSESQPGRMSKWVNNIISVLREESDYIRTRQQHWGANKLAKSEEETEALRQCYCRIESSFRQLQTDASLSTWKIADDHFKASRLNELHAVYDARYDSSFSEKIERKGCLNNTRVMVLETIRQWVKDPSGAKVHWMSGMAGTGKTAIAYTVCQELEKNGRLGASYFCFRASPNCQDVGRIFPTIAYQLAQSFYPFRSTLCRILGEDPSVIKRNLSVQFEYLIKSPILEVKTMLPEGLVVVIDGLDECTDSRTTRALLELLLEYTQVLPLRFFFTSRPELGISDLNVPRWHQTVLVMRLHDVQKKVVEGDIRTYLSVVLAKFNLSGEQIQKMAERAGVLFIYAVTLTRYLLGGSPGSSTSSRLSAVLSGDSVLTGKQSRDVDYLYKTILDQIFENETLEESELELIQNVLWTVVCAREPVTKTTLAALLKADNEKIGAALQPLQSVLHISESSQVVATMHSSFPEFLLQSALAGSLHCDHVTHNKHLAARCFVVMEKQLQFNISGLRSSYIFDNDVQGLSRQVNAISSELYYACRYWAEHLRLSITCDQLLLHFGEFLRTRLLSWLEVLNLKKSIKQGPRALIAASEWLRIHESSPEISETGKFIRDAYTFTTTFAANPVCQSTPHLYLSMLPMTSARNRVRDNYWTHFKETAWVYRTTLNGREGVPLVTWEIGCDVTAVAYSPDAMRVAYGCQDGSIQVWDTYYGTRLNGRFKGHDKLISSLAFSPKGTHLISSSRDCIVRIWDAEKGVALDSFKDHTQPVNSVTFSPDGTRVASAGDDCTIRLRNSDSGALIAGPLQGHTSGVTSIAFSPDGAQLVSGSYDCTIRVWATHIPNETALAHPFKGHEAGILSVTFSPDGGRVASGSLDHSVRIWSSSTGIPLASPFKGHTDSVSAVVFSTDGTRVISGSWDCTVRIWDASQSTQIAGPFTGHSQGVTCLTLSPDGRTIISGSWDGYIHFWDAHAKPAESTVLGHTKAITCVEFSPDGASLISSSADSAICIWDAYTGELRHKPFTGHAGGVNSTAFSPDKEVFLSGGDDCTARLWDATNGRMINVPPALHKAGITSVAFSPVDGTSFATGSHDNTLCVWNSQGTELANRFEGHTQSVTSLAFSPDGKHILSGSWDNTIRLWSTDTGAIVAQRPENNSESLDGHNDIVTCIAFAPDGTCIASGSFDGTVQVRSASMDGPILAKLFERYANAVTSVVFSPNSARLVAGSRDGTIRMWDAQKGILISDQFKGHTDAVCSVAFAPGGQRLASGSNDHTIRIWEISAEYGPQGTWTMSPEGWLTDPLRRPVLWVPADMRKSFPRPPNTHLFHPRGSVTVTLPKVDLAFDEICRRRSL